MLGISNGNRFITAIKRGVSGIQEAYRWQKKAAEDRADRRMKAAKFKYEEISIEADLKLEKLKLQREMYEAIAAVKREEVAVAKAKREAGVVGIGERAGGFIRAGRRFYRGLVAPPKPKRKRRKVKAHNKW